MIYVSPRPNAEEVTHIYTDDEAAQYADTQYQFESYNRMVARKALAQIKNLRAGGSILELGTGGGSFLVEAREHGYEPYGIELNPIEAKWINEKLKIPCENKALSKDSFGGRQFDIVYHRNVLSHLSDPIGVFQDINRALKKGGLLVFETGNVADVREKYYKWFSEFSYPEHLFFFGEKSLKALLERTGFKCLQIHRDPILLRLMLQKSLWSMKDVVKDRKAVETMKLPSTHSGNGGSLSLKRRLRLLYRYGSHSLMQLASVLPKEGRPLTLLVVAEKQDDSR